MNLPSSSAFLIVLLLLCSIYKAVSTLERCRHECEKNVSFREKSTAMKGIPLASLVFNYSHNCTNSDVDSTVLDQEFEYDVSKEHEKILIETIESVLRAQFPSYKFDFDPNTAHVDGDSQSPLLSFSTSIFIYLARDGSQECTSFSSCEFEFDQGTKDIITAALEETILQLDDCVHNASFKLKLVAREEILNPFSGFCQLGCAHFYASESDPLHVSECNDVCDDEFSYDIEIGYNELIEIHRLQCHDGCKLGLKLCRPGYKCSQISLNQQDMEVGFQGGIMEHCPSGTYRHVNSETVEQCIPCPAGRFREDIKGKSLEDCMKCPPRTYNSKEGSSSIADCLRCPAGTFSLDPGSTSCICVTPSACQDTFPSPGDAEKRDTVPYIGRW